jgi:hypothetical protein
MDDLTQTICPGHIMPAFERQKAGCAQIFVNIARKHRSSLARRLNLSLENLCKLVAPDSVTSSVDHQ